MFDWLDWVSQESKFLGIAALVLVVFVFLVVALWGGLFPIAKAAVDMAAPDLLK